MRQMIEEVKKYHFPDRAEWIQSALERREGMQYQFDSIAEEAFNRVPVHPTVLTKSTVDWLVENQLTQKSIMAIDGGDNIYWWAMLAGVHGIPMEFANQVAGSMSLALTLGSVGMAIPLAIGSAVAYPGKLLLIPTMGDGSIGYHLAELETMARLRIPAVIVVHNNGGWGMVYADQRRIWGKQAHSGSLFSDSIHYEKAAEGLGCATGEFVTKPDEIRPALDRALERALKESKPVVVNCVTDINAYIIPWGWWLLPESAQGEPYEGIGL
jgi:thiamine pyrophosphate-dependent acetolactate synthase large subunit-like protein